MNKQEAIELLHDVANRAFYRTGRRSIHIDEIVELVNQIDEPQKYEVEKEKLYTVEIPDPNSFYKHRFLSRNYKGVCIGSSSGIDWKQRSENQLTESEIKQDFEWAWQWAKEVETDE